jgi:heterogeneous nuclear rnp K-like protein 2
MVASKEILPQSTEHIVEVQGSPEVIGRAVEENKVFIRGLGTRFGHGPLSLAQQ